MVHVTHLSPICHQEPSRSDGAAGRMTTGLPAGGTERNAPFVRLSTDGQGGLAELLQLLGSADTQLADGAQIPVPVRRLHEGATLFHEGAPADGIYFVRAGTFKVSRIGEDGYEQVLGFVGRGELLGFDAIALGQHANQVVALEESSVYTILLNDYFCAPARNPVLDRAIFAAASLALQQRSELAEMMAAVAAEVRLARFLLQLSRRLASCGLSARRIHLRMSRRDIASYLGVAHETVSRSFSALVTLGLVEVSNRDVEILDMAALKCFAAGTRRQVDDGLQALAQRKPTARTGAMALAA